MYVYLKLYFDTNTVIYCQLSTIIKSLINHKKTMYLIVDKNVNVHAYTAQLF